MSTPNRKRRIISLDVKKQILEAAANKKPTELSKQFDLPTSTVKTILGDRVAILRAIEEGGDAKRTRLYPVKHEDVEMGLFQWFKEQRSKNTPMSGPLLMEKAKKLANKLAKPLRKALANNIRPLTEDQAKQEQKAQELEGFKASEGWCSGFKNRHSIVFRGSQGEAAEIDLKALGDWQQICIGNRSARIFETLLR